MATVETKDVTEDQELNVGKAKNIVETFFDFFQVRGQTTDPELIKDILKNDLFFYESELIMSEFSDTFFTPQRLDPLLDSVSEGLFDKHPAVVEFLSSAIEQGLIVKNQESAEIARRILHCCFILDKTTEKQLHDYQWSEKLFDYFHPVRDKKGIKKGVLRSLVTSYRVSGRWFVAAKVASLELVSLRYLKRMRKKNFKPGSLSDKFNQKLWVAMLNLNIYEATLQDWFSKQPGNSEAGFILTCTNAERVTDDGQILYHNTQLWASLYHTWNLCFITGDLPHLDLMYPKLLIPAVANASGDHYIHARAIILTITFSLMTLRIANNQPSAFEIQNKEKLCNLWGEINRKYARELLAVEEKKGRKTMGWFKRMIYKKVYLK
ncbi:hypothetical protein CS022_20765 [Veronia nyctiphanis]|uniref:Uncharacterized protein n=1 Tax=Veronia nyctiphanis TaxID=1278244 RepID=A0A4Q0YL73_9GAMM|nr:hypothetical protein [Veronia nyctiphanis]RXJ71522.1 hypothetical protein CS022_20765 [Veronia nyctiphanis]